MQPARIFSQALCGCGRWEDLLSAPDAEWRDRLEHERPRAKDDADWRREALQGGYPTPALDLQNAADRRLWFEGYVRTYLERDLQDLATISCLPDFRRLLRAASLRVGQILNQSELGRDLALTQPTVHRWLNLLETSYLVVRVPAYSVNRTKRLAKAPKLYFGDTGLALHLAGLEEPTGAHFENFILQDLLCWRDARVTHAELYTWRTTAGEEVDFVIESAGQLLPIELKTTARPRLSDCKHLLSFQEEYATSARAGLLLHTGDAMEWLTPRILAAPWWRVL